MIEFKSVFTSSSVASFVIYIVDRCVLIMFSSRLSHLDSLRRYVRFVLIGLFLNIIYQHHEITE